MYVHTCIDKTFIAEFSIITFTFMLVLCAAEIGVTYRHA